MAMSDHVSGSKRPLITTNEVPIAGAPFAPTAGTTATRPTIQTAFNTQWIRLDTLGVPIMHEDARGWIIEMAQRHLPKEQPKKWSLSLIKKISDELDFGMTARDVTLLHQAA
jgi:hypothetical protein